MADYAAVTDNQAKYVGGKDNWTALNEGTHTGGWALVQTKSDFEALATGDLSAVAGKDRLVGVAQVANTLQFDRSGYTATDKPFDDPMIATVPTLETMTKAALNVLSSLDNGKGMFLHIEGGAVDWAAHANATARIVEEQYDFNTSVDAVISWIEGNGGWGENLLIIIDTTDVFSVTSQVVPEPGSLVLLVMGVVAIAACRRRSRD